MSDLSEEEKKAIDKLSSKKNETTWNDTIRQIKREEITDVVVTRQKYITIILNLIEKQQAEIENKDNKIASKDKEIKLLKEFHNKHIKIIDKMAEELTTPLHSKEWIINFYTKLVKEK